MFKNDIDQDIANLKSLIELYRQQGTEAYRDKKLAEQQAVIDEALAKMAKVNQNFADSAERVAQTEKNLRRLEMIKKKKQHRSELARIEKLRREIEELQNAMLKSEGVEGRNI